MIKAILNKLITNKILKNQIFFVKIKLQLMRWVDYMSINFKVSDIAIKAFYANEAMREVVEGLNGDILKKIEIVDNDMIDSNHGNEEWANIISEMDVIIPGNLKLLNMAGIEDKRMIKEVAISAFIKMFLKYMSKHNKKIFIIAISPEVLNSTKTKVSEYFEEDTVEGMSVSELTGRSEEEIINEINALEPDCILSVLPSPKQEEFINKNKSYINSRIWLGCGEVFDIISGKNKRRNLLKFFKKDKNNM